jgi:hypothetical protein
MMQEIAYFRGLLADKVDWDPISKVIFLEIKKDNNMVLLQNVSHLESYLNDLLIEKLIKATLMRIENETKMQFF